MTFQFRCPGGCLLEGDPSQAGSTITCPVCGQMFVVPAPIAAAPQTPAAPQQAPGQPHSPVQPQAPIQPHAPIQQQPQAPMQQQPQPHAPMQPQPQAPMQQQQPQAPMQPQTPAQPQAAQHPPAAAIPAQAPATGQPQQPAAADQQDAAIKTSPASRILGDSYRVLNFPCPCGQWVEAPRELAGQQATCPHCHQPFQLLETESREYREAVEIARRRREARVGNAWLNWAIAVAVFVLIGLAALIIKSQLDN